MLLRTTFSSTKKFFQKTVESVKYFFSGAYENYERLPKSSPCSSFPCGVTGVRHQVKHSQSYRELDKIYADSTAQWDDDADNKLQIAKGRSRKKKEASRNDDGVCDKYLMNYHQVDQMKENTKKKKAVGYDGKMHLQIYSSNKVLREERSFLVAKKLKELEMMDEGNVEHVLDIEEVLHYYSRLTCPAYVDIVDKFFMDMYSELLNGQASSLLHNSRPLIQRVGF